MLSFCLSPIRLKKLKHFFVKSVCEKSTEKQQLSNIFSASICPVIFFAFVKVKVNEISMSSLILFCDVLNVSCCGYKVDANVYWYVMRYWGIMSAITKDTISSHAIANTLVDVYLFSIMLISLLVAITRVSPLNENPYVHNS
ncbi:hypothetical protein Niako_3280 [Niastella koreensis GR20-10]|uniref:Uncharacterized protein n=1 Tax=Niastella koreensis (strain DSM 17620 / KACC 11465 / NBRC 106392 / GR20-10) TaxID=700598 RepID=G8TI01_NIAKG|nr:hypothetical protein Niako_3280 [Niastella koreensis GR20-10]